MFADKYPALLINERRIQLSIFRRCDEDGVLVNFDNFVPGNEFIRPAHAVFDIKSYRNRKRFDESKYEIGESPDFLAEATTCTNIVIRFWMSIDAISETTPADINIAT